MPGGADDLDAEDAEAGVELLAGRQVGVVAMVIEGWVRLACPAAAS